MHFGNPLTLKATSSALARCFSAAEEPMVCMTLPWRKPDSNHQYRVIRPRFQEGSCRLCLIPPNGKVDERELVPRRRRAPSAGPMVRILFPPAESQVRTCLSREFGLLG